MKKKLVSFLLALCLLAALTPAVLADNATPSPSPTSQNTDYIAFYLTQYTLKAGDTMQTVCSNRGVTFSSYETIIKNINKITSFNYLVAGTVYWLPITSAGSAAAYYAVYKHTLVSGDTVSNLCTKYGISLSTYSDLILQLNDASSLTGFKVGKTILIPVYTATAAATATATTTAAATATAAAATATAAPQNNDYVSFYLTKYTLQSGDTMMSVCSTRGITFSSYQTIIKNVNKISSFNSLVAGRSYWVPATSVGAATEYYAVYKHILVSGDTVYNLCQAYGISLSKYSDLILQLNNAKSLTGFKAGKTILIPVYKAAAASSTAAVTVSGTAVAAGSTAAGGTTTSTTNPDGSTTTTTTTTTTSVSEAANLFDASSAAKYYMAAYTVKSGDTLISICNGLGSSYSKNSALIIAANGLAATGNITVGAKLWIPVKAAPSGTADYYTVTQHAMAAGETVYGICKSSGADFSASYKLLTALNSGVNFNTLRVGQTLWIPLYAGKAA